MIGPDSYINTTIYYIYLDKRRVRGFIAGGLLNAVQIIRERSVPA